MTTLGGLDDRQRSLFSAFPNPCACCASGLAGGCEVLSIVPAVSGRTSN